MSAPPHTIATTETGMVRIYLLPRDKAPGPARRWRGAMPLYRALVVAAKKAGIPNAIAHQTHFGFSDGGALQSEGYETPNPSLTMCVEMIGPRPQLEAFCREHGAWLEGKVIVYKHLENWSVVGQRLVAAQVTS